MAVRTSFEGLALRLYTDLDEVSETVGGGDTQLRTKRENFKCRLQLTNENANTKYELHGQIANYEYFRIVVTLPSVETKLSRK